MSISNRIPTYAIILLASVAITVLVIPIINSSFFMQNDDWIYYLNIQSFLDGNFYLHNLTAPTFYTQGIDAYIFSLLFGIEKLPVLTIIVSILTIIILILILKEIVKLSTSISILIALVLMFTPLFVYSMVGFMTDNYFLMWLALLYYFLFKYNKSRTDNSKALIAIIISEILVFYLRQVGIVFIAVSIIWFAINKKWTAVKVQIAILVLLLFSYYFLFPQTPEMTEKSIEISNYFEIKNIGLLYFTITTAIGAFLAPLILFSAGFRFTQNKKYLIALGISALIFTIVYLIIRNPHIVLIDGFPHLTNTFTRKGFFPGGLSGNKYHFKGYYDLFNIWAIVGITSGIIFVSIFIHDLIFKNMSSTKWLLLLSILGYVAILIGSPAMYDRYILPLIMFGILYLAIDFYQIKIKLLKYFGVLITSGFIVFTFAISFAFLTDYIAWNSFVWERSQELINKGVPANKIYGTNSHNKLYGTSDTDWEYYFTFDNPETLDRTDLQLYKTHLLKETLPIFVDPIVYVYTKDALIKDFAISPTD